jgi:hypothetical protein
MIGRFLSRLFRRPPRFTPPHKQPWTGKYAPLWRRSLALHIQQAADARAVEMSQRP